MCKAIAFGDSWPATPMDQGTPTVSSRNAELAKGAHSLKFGCEWPAGDLPYVALVQSRGYYQFTPASPRKRKTTTAQVPRWRASCSAFPPSRQVQAGVPSMNLRTGPRMPSLRIPGV